MITTSSWSRGARVCVCVCVCTTRMSPAVCRRRPVRVCACVCGVCASKCGRLPRDVFKIQPSVCGCANVSAIESLYECVCAFASRPHIASRTCRVARRVSMFGCVCILSPCVCKLVECTPLCVFVCVCASANVPRLSQNFRAVPLEHARAQPSATHIVEMFLCVCCALRRVLCI